MSRIVPDAFPEERRLVTILVAILDGFTRRGDLEQVAELLKAAWQVVDKGIIDRGGFIETHTADEVRAVWGVPITGEDDAEWAVSTALQIQEDLTAFLVESLHPDARTLHLKIGINSGPVMAAYLGLGDDYSLIGETLDGARLLARAAEPESVLIGEQTFRLVRGAFRVREVGLVLEGVDARPVNAFQAQEKLLQPTRVRYTDQGGLETHMVAREPELEQLQSLFLEVNRAAAPRMALVVGDTGLGKSRLLAEYSRQLELENPRLHFFSVRGLAEAEKAPYFLWKALWKHRFGIQESMAAEDARDNFLRGILQIWGNRLGQVSAIEAAHVIGQLVGMEWENSPYLQDLEAEPGRRKRRAFDLTRELFKRLAESGPVVLLIDDLQWVDRGSLELLSYLLQPLPASLPLFVLAGARAEFPKTHVQWVNLASLIHLHPIPFSASLVKAAYPVVAEYPEDLLESLAIRSEGNPYFLEEIVKSIVQTGGEFAEAPSIPPDAITSDLPESLRSLLQARLGALSPESREVLLLASVVGRMFWVGAIKEAAKQPMGTSVLNLPEEVLDRVVQNALRQIVRAELAFPRSDSIFSGQQEYIFKHTMLREVAYEMLPLKHRRFYHFSIARWLSKRAGPDFHVMIAGHYEKAGGVSAALRHYIQAVKYAQASGAEGEVQWLKERIRLIQTGEQDEPNTRQANPT